MNGTIFHWVPSSQLGGIEMAALTLIQESPQHTHVVAIGNISGPAVDLWRGAGAEVIEIPAWRGRLGIAWFRHWRRFVRERDVRHLISWSPTRIAMVTSPLRADARCLVHLGNVGGFSRRARIQEGLARAVLRSACKPQLVACSRTVMDSVSEEPAFSGYSRLMVYNPVRRAFFEVGATRQSLSDPIRKWGMIARLDRLKDHRTLIEAVGMLPPSLDFCLEIVGEGELDRELKALVASGGLEDKIRFTGSTSAPQAALARWDGFVFSTTAAEGFGIAVAEAMATGLPCVLSDVRALREVAGTEAYFAASGDASQLAKRLLQVTSDPAAARAMGQSASLRAAVHYAPEAFAQSYLAALGLASAP